MCIRDRLEPIINKIKPSVVYTHHFSDLNIDHQITNAAVMTACRPTPETSDREIYGFEVLSSTEWSISRETLFNPTFFVNINNEMSQKMKAIKAYDDEMRDPPHSRSIEHLKILAKHRGFSVGISDLISDNETTQKITDSINKKKKEVYDLIDQLHISTFENNTGKPNVEDVLDPKGNLIGGRFDLGDMDSALLEKVKNIEKHLKESTTISLTRYCTIQRWKHGKTGKYIMLSMVWDVNVEEDIGLVVCKPIDGFISA